MAAIDDALAGVAWDEPVPLLDSGPRPVFPVEALPDWLRDYVTELARATQTPPDLPGVMVLGVLAAAAGGRAVIEPRPDWREPTNLFLGVAMAPGNRKSAVAKAVAAPLHRAEESETQRMKGKIAEATTQKQIAEGRALQAIRAAEKGDDPDMERAALDAAAIAEAITVPVMPRLLADDATPEALASLMAAQHGRIALISAEGGPFDMMAGKYSKFPPLDVYLKGHAGDHLRVDRKGREPEFIEAPALTIAVCFQPAILPTLAGREGFRARGLLARFLFSVPHSFVGRRKIGEAPIDPEVEQRFGADAKALVLTLSEWTDPCVLTFAPEANEVLLGFEHELEPRLAPDGTLGMLPDWGSKLAGEVVRIAGLLHLAENLKTGYRQPIKAASVESAITIGNYFLAHAIAANNLMGGGPAPRRRSRPARLARTHPGRHLLPARCPAGAPVPVHACRRPRPCTRPARAARLDTTPGGSRTRTRRWTPTSAAVPGPSPSRQRDSKNQLTQLTQVTKPCAANGPGSSSVSSVSSVTTETTR
jgi:hypothetical protein